MNLRQNPISRQFINNAFGLLALAAFLWGVNAFNAPQDVPHVGVSEVVAQRTAGKDPVIIDAVTRSELLNTIGTTPSQASGINYQFFKGQFQAKFNTDPENYSFIPHGYDAMYVVMLAAAWASQTPAGVTGATMAEGMTKLSAMGTTAIPLNATTWSEASNKLSSGTAIDIDGTSGSLNFDLATGAPPAPYDVWQALDGGFRINQTLNP